MTDGISIIIPTLNGGKVFSECIAQIKAQQFPQEVQLIIIDSGSTDNTLQTASNAGATIKKIAKDQFHHAGTRNSAINYVNHDKVIFTVQDAIPLTQTWLADMVSAIDKNQVDALFGRQIPHEDASIYAQFEVNLHNKHLGDAPDIQYLRESEDINNLSYHEILRKIRLDNVCAIYRTASLKKIPFPLVAFGEDMAWAYETMRQGGKIMYHPGITVKHSHNRTPEYRFRRGIVDAVNCAQIIGKTDTTMLFSFRDLVLLAQSIANHSLPLRQEIESWYAAGGAYYDTKSNNITQNHTDIMAEILGSFSLTIADRLRIKAINFFCKKYHLLPYALTQLQPAQVANEIRNHFFKIKEESDILLQENAKKHGASLIRKQDLYEILDQVTVGFLARIFGVTYASHILNGTNSKKLYRFIAPYLQDV